MKKVSVEALFDEKTYFDGTWKFTSNTLNYLEKDILFLSILLNFQAGNLRKKEHPDYRKHFMKAKEFFMSDEKEKAILEIQKYLMLSQTEPHYNQCAAIYSEVSQLFLLIAESYALLGEKDQALMCVFQCHHFHAKARGSYLISSSLDYDLNTITKHYKNDTSFKPSKDLEFLILEAAILEIVLADANPTRADQTE